jgi:hypothetical protein
LFRKEDEDGFFVLMKKEYSKPIINYAVGPKEETHSIWTMMPMNNKFTNLLDAKYELIHITVPTC